MLRHSNIFRTYLSQTCHSIEMKNLDLINKKSGFRGKNRDHGRIGYTNRNNSPKERTDSICSFFLPRNVLNFRTSVFFSCLFCLCVCVCVCCFLVFSLRSAHSWLSFLTLDIMNQDKIKIWSIYVCYCRSSPETFKNPSTGLKLTKIRLDVLEKSRDQVKIEVWMMHWVAFLYF